jgi:hypothetical protein
LQNSDHGVVSFGMMTLRYFANRVICCQRRCQIVTCVRAWTEKHT